MGETAAFYSPSHSSKGFAWSTYSNCPTTGPENPGEASQLHPRAEWATCESRLRKKRFASNLISFTYLKSLNQRILPKKLIDRNEIIRSARSSSRSCGPLRIGSRGLSFGLVNYVSGHYETKGGLSPCAEQTHSTQALLLRKEFTGSSQHPALQVLTFPSIPVTYWAKHSGPR